MRLALDNQVHLMTVSRLRKKHTIVVMAKDRQDFDWVSDAINLGAEVIISPDLDIPNLLDQFRSKIFWIDLPQKIKGRNQYKYISEQLKNLDKINEEERVNG